MRAVVDTSFWIDYARGAVKSPERSWIESLWRHESCVLYQFVWLELIVGFRSPKEQRMIQDYRAMSLWEPMESADGVKAESFAALLRGRGHSLSASDLLILAAADRLGAKLIHHDADFTLALTFPEFVRLRVDPADF